MVQFYDVIYKEIRFWSYFPKASKW